MMGGAKTDARIGYVPCSGHALNGNGDQRRVWHARLEGVEGRGRLRAGVAVVVLEPLQAGPLVRLRTAGDALDHTAGIASHRIASHDETNINASRAERPAAPIAHNEPTRMLWKVEMNREHLGGAARCSRGRG